MSITRPTLAAGLIVLTVGACGPPPQPAPATIAIAPKPTAPIAPAPAPARARWVFAHPEKGLNAKLDLGDGQTLFVGQYGRRALAKADGTLVDAQTLAFEHLTGVYKDGASYVFVADDGDINVAQDPLGALGPTIPGPLADTAEGKPTKFSSMATGHASVIGITNDGRVLRTSDSGKHWAPVDYAGGNRTFGHPYSVALDSKGNGLLLALPQHLYITRDDGATWAPIATPGIGASSVRRDGADRIFFWGYTEHARLDGAQLVVTTDSAEPLRRPPATSGPVIASSNEPTQMILTGDRIVEFALHRGARSTVEVTSRKIGDAPAGPGTSTSDLVSARTSWSSSDANLSPFIAGYDSNLIYARADDTKDADGAVTTTLMSSTDLGATWHSDGTFKGHIADHGFSDRGVSAVAAGPRGWAFVRAMCPPGAPESSDKCTRRQVRPGGAAAFEDLAAVEDFAPVKFAFDEAHAKVYVLGKRDGRFHVYESALGQNKFSRLKLLDATGPTAITVDPNGTLRVLTYDWQVGQWKLLRHTADGTDSPAGYGPVDSGEISLAGLKGIISGDHSAWETADGGETWSRVASNGGGAGDLACTDAGCVMGGAERVGWDLPAYDSPEKIAIASDPKKSGNQTRPQHSAVAAPAPIQLTCKAGATTQVPTTTTLEATDVRAADVRWTVLHDDKDHKVSVVVGGKSSVRELALLGAEPPKPTAKPGGPPPEAAPQTRTFVFHQREGEVAVRAGWTPRVGEPAPVDLEIAWFTAATGKVSRRTLPKFKAFSVQRWGAIGQARIVDGGVLFQSGSAEPAQFLRDDGKKDGTLTIPNGASIQNAVRSGDRWILPQLSSGTAKLTFSEGPDKWTTKTWRLDEYATTSIVDVNKKPHVAFAVSVGALPSFYTVALLPLDSIGDDPPAPITIAPGAADAPCDSTATTYRSGNALTPGSRGVELKIEKADKTSETLRSYDRLAHPTASGGYCAAVYHTSGDGYVFAEPKGYSAMRFRRAPDPKDSSKTQILAEQLTCSAPPAPAAVAAPKP